MNISFSWLKEYIKTDLTPAEVAEILTSIGLEVGGVEEFETIKGGLEGLVVGEVLTCEPHENSDHLHVTTVNVGEPEPLQIVCGAPNVAKGQKVVVATVGTRLYQGEESFQIKRSKIRGVESFGMICSEAEIGVGSSHAGIIVLPSDVAVGTLAKDYYQIEKDTIIEVDITPNRADAVSHYGVARDLYAYCLTHGIKAELERPFEEELVVGSKGLEISVEVQNTEACPRYAGICIEGVEVKDSPEWLQNRLNSIGLRPINNVVDITNYLLHAYGQPLHAFDAGKIEGGKIIVRNAQEGEKFTTLDGVERTLSDQDLMICDSRKPMCIAGVFGGMDSGVTADTKAVFLESAYFSPVSVRKTARRHGLNTDSSFRFERGANPHDTLYVLNQAVQMICSIAGGEISCSEQDNYPNKIEDFTLSVSLSKIHSLVGKNIDTQTIETILKGLEVQILQKESTEQDTVYTLLVPAYRVDVRRDVDIIEDILRIYGYNNVEFSDSLKSNISYRQQPDSYAWQNTLSEQLTACGFYEIMNNSLTKASYYEKSATYPIEKCVRLINPLSADLSVMRQTLLFGGLESLSFNINRQSADLKFYEFGRCYEFNAGKGADDPLKQYSESNRMAMLMTGMLAEASWLRKQEKATFYDLKSQVLSVFRRLGVKKFSIKEFSDDIYANALQYTLSGDRVVAKVGILRKELLKKFDIKAEVFYAELDFDVLIKEVGKKRTLFSEIPKSPEVSRDLALLIDKKIRFEEIEKIAQETERRLLQRVSLFDVYEGEKLPENKKSYAVNFILQDAEKTLTDRQIDSVMERLQKAFADKLGAEIR